MEIGDNNNNNYNINLNGNMKHDTGATGKIALICSILGALCACCCCTTHFSFIFFLVAIVCGIVALIHNKRDAAAIASLVISGIFTLIAVVLIVGGIGDNVKNQITDTAIIQEDTSTDYSEMINKIEQQQEEIKAKEEAKEKEKEKEKQSLDEITEESEDSEQTSN